MIKNKTLVLLVSAIAMLSFVFAGCSGGTDNEAEENANKEEKTEKDADAKEEGEADTEEEASKDAVSLEDRNYEVEEFAELFYDNKEGLKGQTVTIEGYYMNHNKQKASDSDDEYEYNVTLYKDDSFDNDAAQVFFKMKSKDGEQFKGIKQKDKITVKGKITGDEFFDAPLIEEGVIVK